MPYIKISQPIILVKRGKQIGWYDKGKNYFLCSKCFSEESDRKDIKRSYEAVYRDKLGPHDLYVCDACGIEFFGDDFAI